MPKPIVAIVGRPNVGKSHLFNRFLQKRIAIVEDEPGVTRDRIYARMEWDGKEFVLVDTGGIEAQGKEQLKGQVRFQAELAINEADAIVFVVDGQEGLTPADEEVAALLRRSQKPLVVAVNKIDSPKMEDVLWDFYPLGMANIIPVSAIHGLNTGDLLDAIVGFLPPETEGEEGEGEQLIKITVAGRPNVGKSSLVNALLGQKRVIVSPDPGTTRDAVDTLFQKDGNQFLLVDTAGLRRRPKIDKATEKYSVMRTLRAIERSDVVLLVIDAEQGIAEQDKRIGGYAHEAGRGLLIVVNKWDLIEKDNKTLPAFQREIRYQLPFLAYAPMAFVSAFTGQRVNRILPMVSSIATNQRRQIPTAHLNQLLEEVVQLKPPPARKGRQGKFYYASQTGVIPPSFVFFVNEPKLIHFSYVRYLENQLRQGYEFTGTPLRLRLRKRN